ncbi:protein-cysteine N-palmitoyltransferase HHAT-like [Orbicella faveolata]|uniref:protein-cysteine N-palmitoyltransferase HHAT-like n=1 Tax=Orbicella faveolata TaxID=48498 RepID=UPI0009E6495F|nr:protein-cysteine N-palmitoyltransferase HHAT-like [Orbicella faveolata]
MSTPDMEKIATSRNETNQNRKHGPLPLLEISLYWVLWISLLLYTMYTVFIASQGKKGPTSLPVGLLCKKTDLQDVTDFEWEFWLSAIESLMPAMLLHAIGGIIFSRFLSQHKASYCLLFSLSFLLYFTGLKPVMFMLGHCLLVYMCCSILKSITAVWVCNLGILLSLQINAAKIWQLQFLSTSSDIRSFTLFVSLMANLRCISFSMDYCWRLRDSDKDKPVKPYTLMDLLVYNFYLPLFANGPVVTFDTFQKTFYQPYKPFSKEEIKSLIWDSTRTLWWYFFLEGYLHFIYSTAFTHDPSIFSTLSNWALTGIMYSQLQIFLVKYKVFYRCTGVLARVDRVEVPLPPRCVTTLYLFTDMWKYFDRGLNTWMKRYIYVPVGGSRKGFARQIAGSFLAFAFIWLWHGSNMHTMWWCIPNWLGVVVESLADIVLLLPSVKRLEFYQPYKPFSKEEIKSLIWDSTRTLWWYFFLEGYLHFIYSTAFTHDPSIFSTLSNWALTGIMYSQLQIFLVKYKVFYRCTGVLARVDRVEVPLPPRCVTTLYLFTDMWKYFDRGLNTWMKRYIYVPVGGSRKGFARQIAGSFLAFAFIWLWHGSNMHTMWWCIPNWLGVVVESLADIVLLLPSVKRLEDKLSPAASRRVRALFGVVTLTSLILSNLVFLCGPDPVWFYIKRIFLFGWPSSALLLLFGIYLIVQTDMELMRHISEW